MLFKKNIIIALVVIIFTASVSYAAENAILNVANKIFEESKAIKPLLEKTKDIVLMSSMWDSCIVAKTQLDAYFSMLGIFEVVKEEAARQKAIDIISSWLKVAKKTNELNMKSLTAIPKIYEPTTELHVRKLNGYFAEMNYCINNELKKLSEIKNALKVKK
ncbi:MAG: hypothetical protein JW946_05020 [Candidatus Omnitrophica bacterium]|nr:hypothetical protein [Candidatus Omnitrophota bacterium]